MSDCRTRQLCHPTRSRAPAVDYGFEDGVHPWYVQHSGRVTTRHWIVFFCFLCSTVWECSVQRQKILCEAFGLACGVLRTSVTFNDLGASTGHTFVFCTKTWRPDDGARRRSCVPGPQAVSAQKKKVPTVPITAIPAVPWLAYPHAYRTMSRTKNWQFRVASPYDIPSNPLAKSSNSWRVLITGGLPMRRVHCNSCPRLPSMRSLVNTLQLPPVPEECEPALRVVPLPDGPGPSTPIS